jgi:hypothetical protein
MKRSEMLGKISDVLLQFMPSVDTNRRNLIADVMLTEVEREQMSPPINPETNTPKWSPEND